MIHATQRAQISQKQDWHNVIVKAMCPLGYHRNGFLVTHAFEYMVYGYAWLTPMNQRVLNKLSKERNISVHK